MALSALTKDGYSFRGQVIIGQRPSGRKHKVDILVTAESDPQQIPISMKWQQVPGTTEEKVPYEIICLADAVHKSQGKFKKAYIVLGGEGWRLREYYLSGNIQQFLRNCESVEVISLEGFVAKANQRKL
jgi:hypothetical protein